MTHHLNGSRRFEGKVFTSTAISRRRRRNSEQKLQKISVETIYDYCGKKKNKRVAETSPI